MAETTPKGMGNAMRTILLCSSVVVSPGVCVRTDFVGGLRRSQRWVPGVEDVVYWFVSWVLFLPKQGRRY